MSPLRYPSLARLSERIVVTNVSPELDGGRYPAKATIGDDLKISCDILTDGHDRLRAVVRHRINGGDWFEAPLVPVGNDRWTTTVRLLQTGRFEFTIEAWRDPFVTWSEDVPARIAAKQDIGIELLSGAAARRTSRARCQYRARPQQLSPRDRGLRHSGRRRGETAARLALMQSDETREIFASAGPRLHAVTYEPLLDVRVERRAAAFSAWYELTPRSQSGDAARHGTFSDVVGRMPYVRDMGFDVLYLTPIHPIGTTNRKGRNNSLKRAAR